MLSARNIIKAKITALKSDGLLAEVSASLGKFALKSIITKASASELNLSEGKEVYFIFKAGSVIVSTQDCKIKTSAANKLSGEIAEIKEGAVNALLSVKVANETLVAGITMDSLARLALKKGDKINLLIKAHNVIIGIDK